jgi:hypothetical protein
MEKSDSRVKLITAILALLTALIGAGYFAYTKIGPSLTLSTGVVCTGGKVGITGAKWDDDQQVEFYMGSNTYPIGTVHVYEGGFSNTLNLNSAVAGNYEINGIGQQTKTRVSVNLVVKTRLPSGGC